MRSVDTAWKDVRRAIEAHGNPATIARLLVDLAEEAPWIVRPCQTCGVTAGRCTTGMGRPTARPHAPRLVPDA